MPRGPSGTVQAGKWAGMVSARVPSQSKMRAACPPAGTSPWGRGTGSHSKQLVAWVSRSTPPCGRARTAPPPARRRQSRRRAAVDGCSASSASRCARSSTCGSTRSSAGGWTPRHRPGRAHRGQPAADRVPEKPGHAVPPVAAAPGPGPNHRHPPSAPTSPAASDGQGTADPAAGLGGRIVRVPSSAHSSTPSGPGHRGDAGGVAAEAHRRGRRIGQGRPGDHSDAAHEQLSTRKWPPYSA